MVQVQIKHIHGEILLNGTFTCYHYFSMIWKCGFLPFWEQKIFVIKRCFILFQRHLLGKLCHWSWSFNA